MSKYVKNIGWFFVFLVAFVLGLKQIHEPDLWWMFRTGHWMVENGQVPTVDVFSFTHKGTDWISVKWLFELIAYGFAHYLGPESLGVLQGIVNVVLVTLFIYTTKQLTQTLFNIRVPSSHPWVVFGALIFLFAADFRLTERPEMFSYLFTMVYLYLFTRYKAKPGKFIFWLIPLQILWVNLHEAFAVGMVLLLAFGAGQIFDYWISKKGNKKDIYQLLLAVGLSVLAVAVNPRGFYMFYHPYFLFMVVESNHYTTELNSLFYRPEYYLSFKEPYIAFVSFMIATGAMMGIFITSKPKTDLFTKVGSGYMVSVVAFMYLGLTGYRNVIFPIIILLPLVFAAIIYWTKGFAKTKGFHIASYMVWVLPLVFYFSIVTNIYYTHFSPKNQYGLATLAKSNPAGASKFIKDHNLKNERAFSDYLTSSYFLWELRPGFESFIDLRDLDIFENTFFDEFSRITHFTNYFEESDDKYAYNQVLLASAHFQNLHRYLYHSPEWVQVFADPVAAVYLKNNAENQSLIRQFGPDSIHLESNFTEVIQPRPSAFSNAISHIMWPFYTMTPEMPGIHLKASKYFRSVADFDRAEYQAQQAINTKSNPYLGWIELGNIYLEIMEFIPTAEGKKKYLQMANNAFIEAHKINKDNWESMFGQGQCAFATGEYAYALKLYKKAANSNPNEASSFIKIADCYSMLFQQSQSNSNYVNYWFENMHIAYQLVPENQNLISKLAVAYCQRNQCEEALPFLEKYERSPEVTQSDHEEIQQCLKKCSLKN